MKFTIIPFKIVQKRDIPIDFNKNMMLSYPVHEHYLIEGNTLYVEYKVRLTSKTEKQIEEYKIEMVRWLKKKYKTDDVSIVD